MDQRDRAVCKCPVQHREVGALQPAGRLVVNLFYENSTRTRISFALLNASILWSSERMGAWTWVLVPCMARHSNSALSRFKCEFFAAI